jgi:hypothetical protein
MYSIDEAFHIRMAEMAGLFQIRRELLSVRGKMYPSQRYEGRVDAYR